MFNEDQEAKIKAFASVVKITNACFIKCIQYLPGAPQSGLPKQKIYLSSNELICISNCADAYLELNNNVTNQLQKDLELGQERNKIIFETKT